MRRTATLIAVAGAIALSACGGPNVTPDEGQTASEKLAAVRFGKALKDRAKSDITASCSDDHDGTFRCVATWQGGSASGSVVGDKPSIDTSR